MSDITFIHHVQDVLAIATMQEKKDIKWKEEKKNCLYSDKIIIYIKNWMESIERLLKLLSLTKSKDTRQCTKINASFYSRNESLKFKWKNNTIDDKNKCMKIIWDILYSMVILVKTTMLYYYQPSRIDNKQKKSSAGEDAEQLEFTYTLLRIPNRAATLENNFLISFKVKQFHSSLLNQVKYTCVNIKTCMIVSKAFFIITRNWE